MTTLYTVAYPCEQCGRPDDVCDCSVPDEPICPALEGPIQAARSVKEIVEVCKAHIASCERCNPKILRMPATNELAAPEPRKKAA